MDRMISFGHYACCNGLGINAWLVSFKLDFIETLPAHCQLLDWLLSYYSGYSAVSLMVIDGNLLTPPSPLIYHVQCWLSSWGSSDIVF